MLNKFILHFSIEGYTVWTVDQQGKPLKLQTKGRGLAEAETLIRDVMRLSGVTFDSKEVTERLLAPILGDKLNECSRNDFSFHNLNSELKDVDIDLSYRGGVIVVDITVDIRNEETVSVGREFPCPQNDAFLQALSLTNVVDYIKLMYQCIDGERIGDLDRENQYLSDIYQHLSEDIKETFDVKEPTVIYPEQSIRGETYPYLPFGKGVGLTVRKYEHGYYLDIATPTEPLLYLGIKYDPSKIITEAFLNEVVSLMTFVHATRLKALAEELDVGLHIGEDIVEYSNDKAIEVRITLGKCQLKLEGVLFTRATTISVERATIPNNSLDDIIRDFVSYCRGIDEGIFKKLKEVDLLNERTNKALYDRCIFVYDEQSVTLFVRLFDGSTSHYKLARGSDEVFIQLFEEFLASMEYSLPMLFEAYGQTLVASSRLCPVAEVGGTFNEAMGVKIGTCCREYTSHYAFVFYANFEGSRMEHSFNLDKGPTKSLETLRAFCNGLENLISVSKREMLSSVYRLERGLKVANRVYAALGEDTKKRLEMETPRLEWKEPLLSNYPRIVIPVVAKQRFVAAQMSEKEVWFVLEDAKGNLLYGLDFWIMDESPDEGIRAAFELSRPFFDVEAIKAVSTDLDAPITLNGVRLGKVTTGSSVLPRVMKIVIESVPLIAFASLIVIDKETKQRLTVTIDLTGNVARKVESFAKYANDLFKDFKYFS